jgi:hypothetical protein
MSAPPAYFFSLGGSPEHNLQFPSILLPVEERSAYYNSICISIANTPTALQYEYSYRTISIFDNMSGPNMPGKINFAGMVGAKRRRMRSGGNVSTLANNAPKHDIDYSAMDDDDEEKTTQTSKCKGATTIPIFLKSKLECLVP